MYLFLKLRYFCVLPVDGVYHVSSCLLECEDAFLVLRTTGGAVFTTVVGVVASATPGCAAVSAIMFVVASLVMITVLVVCTSVVLGIVARLDAVAVMVAFTVTFTVTVMLAVVVALWVTMVTTATLSVMGTLVVAFVGGV